MSDSIDHERYEALRDAVSELPAPVRDKLNDVIRIDNEISALRSARRAAMMSACIEAEQHTLDLHDACGLQDALHAYDFTGRGPLLAAFGWKASTLMHSNAQDPRRTHWPKGTHCVYLLIADDRTVVYVGYSANVWTRIKSHRDAGIIQFSDYQTISRPSKIEALDYEAELQQKFLPKHNIRIEQRRLS